MLGSEYGGWGLGEGQGRGVWEFVAAGTIPVVSLSGRCAYTTT